MRNKKLIKWIKAVEVQKPNPPKVLIQKVLCSVGKIYQHVISSRDQVLISDAFTSIFSFENLASA